MNIVTKSIVVGAAVIMSANASAENINVSAGRCGAYHFLSSHRTDLPKYKQDWHMDQAMLAMRHRTNIGQQQVAANLWIDLAQRDFKSAYEQAAWSCILKLKMKMKYE